MKSHKNKSIAKESNLLNKSKPINNRRKLKNLKNSNINKRKKIIMRRNIKSITNKLKRSSINKK